MSWQLLCKDVTQLVKVPNLDRSEVIGGPKRGTALNNRERKWWKERGEGSERGAVHWKSSHSDSEKDKEAVLLIHPALSHSHSFPEITRATPSQMPAAAELHLSGPD